MSVVLAQQHKRQHCKEQGTGYCCVLCRSESYGKRGFCKPHQTTLIRIIDSFQPSTVARTVRNMDISASFDLEISLISLKRKEKPDKKGIRFAILHPLIRSV